MRSIEVDIQFSGPIFQPWDRERQDWTEIMTSNAYHAAAIYYGVCLMRPGIRVTLGPDDIIAVRLATKCVACRNTARWLGPIGRPIKTNVGDTCWNRIGRKNGVTRAPGRMSMAQLTLRSHTSSPALRENGGMKVEISPEDVKRTSKAVDHFVAYLRSQQREDREFERLSEFYRKMVKN